MDSTQLAKVGIIIVLFLLFFACQGIVKMVRSVVADMYDEEDAAQMHRVVKGIIIAVTISLVCMMLIGSCTICEVLG